MRYFPRAVRRRATVALAAGSVLLSLAALPLAAADDLEDRKDRVQQGINKAHKHLDQSSSELVLATRQFTRAQEKLGAAEKHLARTRGQLAAAVVLDRRMQAALDTAVTRLENARAQLEEGRVDVTDQEKTLGQIAVENYQSGDPAMLGLSMVLQSQDPAQLSSQLGSIRSVLDKETVTLQRLEASRVLLTVKEEEVQAAKIEVAAQRRAAARNLRTKQRLEARAARVEARVSDLVSARAVAQRAAEKARDEDLRRVQSLEKERDRISSILRARAARAAARAARQAAREAARQNRESRPSRGSGGGGGYLSYPVNGYITSQYGMRLHPVYKRWTLHDGTDFGAGCGTPIRAAASGKVIAAYYNSAYGNRVIIDNGYARGVGLGTAYNHLSGFSTFVGERVSRGEVIGYVGSTGYSTGCHLHFMVFENGATVNPMSWL